MQRIIFHVDMDAFFAAVEQRDNPELRGKPVIIGGTGKRGVVSTASYEARVFGVGSAMPIARAKERCPQGIFIPPRMSVYTQVSKEIMQIFGHFSPLVEPLSIDEAFLDLSGTEKLFGPPQETAKRLQEEVFSATGLTCSVGMAENKFLAKLCSEMNKPKGITNFLFANIPERLAPLPLNKLWGVGPKTLIKLHELNLKTFGDIQNSDEQTMVDHFGAHGQKLFHLAYGRDEREVTPGEGQKSIGSEMTLSEDIQGEKEVTKYIRRQCNEVAKELRRKKLRGRGIRVKIRYTQGFVTKTTQKTLESGLQDSASIFDIAKQLLARLDLNKPMRLVGVTAFELTQEQEQGQMSLLDKNSKQERREKLEALSDKIEAKFGKGVMLPPEH